jgi:hypothetical protein
VILPSVVLVEGARVGAVQIPHPVGEVRERSLDEQVVVVAHQAADVGAPAVAPFDTPEEMEEDDPVAVVQHDRGVVVTSNSDVVVGPGGEVTVWPSHLPKVARRKPRSPRCDGFASRPARTRHVPGTRPVRCQARDWGGRDGPRGAWVAVAWLGARARPRLWSVRGADARGSNRAPGGACAGTACPCASSPGSGRRRRPGLLPRSAPR